MSRREVGFIVFYTYTTYLYFFCLTYQGLAFTCNHFRSIYVCKIEKNWSILQDRNKLLFNYSPIANKIF